MRTEPVPGIRLCILGTILALSLVAVPRTIHAQVDAQTFHPVADQMGYFSVPASSPLEQGVLSGGFFFNYVVGPIRGAAGGTSQSVDVTRWVSTADLLLAYGIFDWWDVSIDVPLSGVHGVKDIEAFLGKGSTAYDSAFGIGDLRFETKLSPISARQNVFGLAFRPYVTAPTGQTADFFGIGSDGPTFGVDLIVDIDLDYLRAGIDLGYFHRKSLEFEERPGDTYQYDFKLPGDGMAFGAGLAVPVAPIDALRIDLMAEVYGSSTFDGFLKEEGTTPVEGIFGLRYHCDPLSMDLTLGGGVGFNSGIGSPAFRIVAGVTPMTARPEKPAEGKKERPVRAAPPAAPPSRVGQDTDNDGIPDVEDLCPEDAGSPEAYGCPIEGRETPPGQPARPLSVERQAAATRAPVSAPVPPQPRAGGENLSFAPIYFETGSGRITQNSYLILNRLIKALQANPALRVKLEGHSDNQGNKQENLSLSLRRASYVKAYLVQPGGINPARILINGLGDQYPLSSNNTPEGRARNRRVEIVVIEPAQ